MAYIDIKREYPALSLISKLLKYVGTLMILASVVGIIGGIILISDYEGELGIPILISSIVTALLSPLLFFGYSELIKLFIKIEYNTRNNNDKSIFTESNYITKETRSTGSNSEYEEWKKKNPGKSINDFYAKK